MISLFKKIRSSGRSYCTAVVAAAGSSRRMGGTDKQMYLLDGVPVLVHSLMALQKSVKVDAIVVAAREEKLVEVSALCREFGITKCTKVVRGGASRMESVLAAALEAPAQTQLLTVHDGARPLVTPEQIDSVVAAAEKHGAAAPAIPLKDTVKCVRDDDTVETTLPRDALRAVQTPQVFDADLLKAALQSAIEQNAVVTDDCSAVERLGKTVFLVEGDEENFKITTPVDLILAETLLRER